VGESTSDTHLTAGAGRLAVAHETLQQVDPIHDPRWCDLVERSPLSSVFHTPAWLSALRRTYGYEPVAFTDAAEGERLTNALPFCRVTSFATGKRYVSLPFSDHCEPLVEDPLRLAAMLKSLQTLANHEHRYIDMKPVRALEAPGAFEATQRFQWHRIDLRPDLDSIFRNFHHSHTRRAVRKAERVGVSIDTGVSDTRIRDFYVLHRMTRRRHRAPVQPLRWFENLAAAFGSGMQIYQAQYEGRPVASILTLLHKRTLVYKYGCSDAAFKKYGATPALFWRAIVDAKSAGCVEMDLGRSDMDHHGLIAFKEHLGGQAMPLTYYRHVGTARSFRVPRWMTALQRLLSCAPERVQLRAGNVLYKHFG
jgi:CelD/BcsL family acetyltransferase involved in cellulose biosynthesis